MQSARVQNKFQNNNNHTESVNWKQILIMERKHYTVKQVLEKHSGKTNSRRLIQEIKELD